MDKKTLKAKTAGLRRVMANTLRLLRKHGRKAEALKIKRGEK